MGGGGGGLRGEDGGEGYWGGRYDGGVRWEGGCGGGGLCSERNKSSASVLASKKFDHKRGVAEGGVVSMEIQSSSSR